MPENMPTVPNVVPSAAQASGGGDLQQVLAMAGLTPTQAPSPYTQTTGAPTINQGALQPNIKPMQSTNNMPMTNTPNNQTAAKRQNAIAMISNGLTQFANKKNQEKSDQLKADVTNVLKYQQNISNAQSVLSQDPNNKMAQQVMAANKKQLEAVLGDDKKRKGLEKAFDISFVDPEKNKTPEVQAMQQAAKQFNDNKAGMHYADNPVEAAIAKLANGSNNPVQQGVQGNPSQAPVPQAQGQGQGQQAQSAPPQQQTPVQQGGPQGQQQQAPPQTQAQVKEQIASKTPYSDQLIEKSAPEMAANPQYAEWLKSEEGRKKLLGQYVIPKLIDQETRTQLESQRQNGSMQRALLREQGIIAKTLEDNHTKLQLEGAKEKAAAQRVSQQQAGAMSRVIYATNARMKVLEASGLNKQLKLQAAGQIDGTLNKQIEGLNNANAKASSELILAKSQKDTERVAALQAFIQGNDHAISMYQNKRKEVMNEAGYTEPPKATSEGKKKDPEGSFRDYDFVKSLSSLFGGKKDASTNGSDGAVKQTVGQQGSDQSAGETVNRLFDPDSYDPDNSAEATEDSSDSEDQ